jgi:hypothetical protein
MDLELDFALLDDILPLVGVSTATAAANIRAARPHALGPLVEYAYQVRGNPACMPSVDELADSTPSRELRRALGRGEFDRMEVSTSLHARGAEFHWIPPHADPFSAPAWVSFMRRLQNAAERAGFPRRVAAGLAGAFGEMADNAFLHSLSPLTALAGYLWTEGYFEYVVADSGQGVLASLRSCPDYAHLEDCGQALQVALTEGESRLGRSARRGQGFRQVFLSLSNLNGHLRFRSGDHALTIDGTSPALSRAHLNQLGLDFTGFLVSVVCHPS